MSTPETCRAAYRNISSRRRYSLGWALASATICLQASRYLALSLHSSTTIFLRSMDTSSSHLILGLPLHLVAYSFPYNIFFGISVSCILSMCPSHCIIWHLINLTMFSPLIMASNSSFCRILHNSSSFTGPYIFRKIYLQKCNKLNKPHLVGQLLNSIYLRTLNLSESCNKHEIYCEF